MDEPMRKSGQWPNVAIIAGSDPREILLKHIEQLEYANKLATRSEARKIEHIEQLEELVRDACWLIMRAEWPVASMGEVASDWYVRMHNLGIEVEQ